MKRHLMPLLCLLLVVAGCQSPLPFLSSGELLGTEVEVSDWSAVEDKRLMAIEVRPDEPYSVNLRTIFIDGKLYIDAAERRQWHDYLKADPRVRVRFGKTIIRAVAVLETDEQIIGEFSDSRVVYRLEPQHWRGP